MPRSVAPLHAAPIHSSRIGRGGKPPRESLSCVALPDAATEEKRSSVGCLRLAFEPSYPEGNFEGNQLLGGSIGLSPLCHTQTTQFARQNSDRPPPQFPTASSWNGIVHHLSGPMDLARTRNPVRGTRGPVVQAGGDVEDRKHGRATGPCGTCRRGCEDRSGRATEVAFAAVRWRFVPEGERSPASLQAP